MVAANRVEDTVANDVVNDLNATDKLSGKVLKEVNDFRQSNSAAPEKLNQALSRATIKNHLPELQIVDSADDHVTLSDTKNHKNYRFAAEAEDPSSAGSSNAAEAESAASAKPNNTDRIFGDPNNPNKQFGFNINADGTATHVIQAGEKVWDIVKAELWSKTGAEPSAADISKEIKHIQALNPDLDFSKTRPGTEIHLPKDSVDAANNGTPVEEKHVDATGTVRTVTRDSEGNISKIAVQNSAGEPGDTWVRDEKDARVWHCVGPDGKQTGDDFHGDIRYDGENYITDDDVAHRRRTIDKDGNVNYEGLPAVHTESNGTKQTINYDKNGNVSGFTTETPGQPTDSWVVDPRNPKVFYQIGVDGKPTGKEFHGTVSIDGDNYIQDDEVTHHRTTWDKDGQPNSVDVPEVHTQSNGTSQTIEHDGNGKPNKVTVQEPGSEPIVYERDANNPRLWHATQGGQDKGVFKGDIRIEGDNYVYDSDETHRRTSKDKDGKTSESDASEVHEQADGTRQTVEYDSSGKPKRVTVECPNKPTIVYVRDADDERTWHYIGSDGQPRTFNGAIFIDGDKYVYEDDDTSKRTKIDKQGIKAEEPFSPSWW